MPVKVEIKMNVDLMADFMVYHIFTSGVGMMAIILAAVNMGFSVALAIKGRYAYTVLFFLVAVVIMAGFPQLIRMKVKKRLQNSKQLTEPVIYEFDEQGIKTTIKDDSGKASWSKFKRAVLHKNLLILYDPEKRAIIIPVEQISDQYEAVVEMIRTHMPAQAVRIRTPENMR